MYGVKIGVRVRINLPEIIHLRGHLRRVSQGVV